MCQRLFATESARTGQLVEELEREASKQTREYLDAAIAAEEAVVGE